MNRFVLKFPDDPNEMKTSVPVEFKCHLLVYHLNKTEALNQDENHSPHLDINLKPGDLFWTMFSFTTTTPALTQSAFSQSAIEVCSTDSEQRDSRGRCTSHLLCIPLLIPFTSTTRAPLEKTLPNFPNQWKSLKGWQRVQSMPVFTYGHRCCSIIAVCQAKALQCCLNLSTQRGNGAEEEVNSWAVCTVMCGHVQYTLSTTLWKHEPRCRCESIQMRVNRKRVWICVSFFVFAFFSHASGVALEMAILICQSTTPDWNISTIIGLPWIEQTFMVGWSPITQVDVLVFYWNVSPQDKL